MCGYISLWYQGSGVRFSKLPKTFWARNAILCVRYLPKDIQFSFVLKATQKNLKSIRTFALVLGLKSSRRIERD